MIWITDLIARRLPHLASLLALCLICAACGGSPPAPTTPSPLPGPAPAPQAGSSGGTYQGLIRATDAPCESNRVFGDHQGKPCHRYGPFEVPKSGELRVDLTWTLSSVNDLEFELWRNGLPYTESGNETPGGGEWIGGGSNQGTYEVRVVYLGSTSKNYTLQVAFTWSAEPSPSPSPSPGGNSVVINEFRSRGPNGPADEFIELRNDTANDVNIGSWQILASDGSGSVAVRRILQPGIVLGSGCHFLLTNATGYSGSVLADDTYGVAIADDGGLAVANASGTIIDRVGMSAGSAFIEGLPLAPFGDTNSNRSYARTGNDANNNRGDFAMTNTPTPQNRSASCAIR
jgi:hypothetical protein